MAIDSESAWLASDKPAEMVDYVIAESRHPRSGALAQDTARKLRLFAEGVEGWWACSRGKQAGPWDGTFSYTPPVSAEALARECVRIHCLPADEPAIAAIMRDVFANPFAPPAYRWSGGVLCAVAYAHHGMSLSLTEYLEPVAWLAPQAAALAEAAYEERGANGALDPLRLGVLADKLEEDGCQEPDLLAHLRGLEPCWACDWPDGRYRNTFGCTVCGSRKVIRLRGPHCVGCHVVDTLLGYS